METKSNSLTGVVVSVAVIALVVFAAAFAWQAGTAKGKKAVANS